ncbi:MAG: hypothetical protein U0694_03900 [Anaerolineae bacterium]
MTDTVIIESEVGEDGTLIIQLPPDSPRGRVRVIVEPVMEHPTAFDEPVPDDVYDPELEVLLSDPTTLSGLGLTAEEIAKSPQIGIWADCEEMADPVAYLAEQRRKRKERRKYHD